MDGKRSSLTIHGLTSELYIFDIWNDNLRSFNREKNEASVPVFYADWTSVPVPQTSSLRGLDVGFIPLLPKELPYMANNDEYTDEYNDEYLCRDFFVGFNFWSRLSFQISEFRVHWHKLRSMSLGLTDSLVMSIMTLVQNPKISATNPESTDYYKL